MASTRFSKAVDGMSGLLSALRESRRCRLADHPMVPASAGVYVFSENGRPMYVGQSRNLKRRLAQHTSTSSRENQAPFAFNLALKAARGRKLDLHGTRKQIEADVAFRPLFMAAKRQVASMDVQFVELEDPVDRTLFEIYASEHLGTEEFNSFETH